MRTIKSLALAALLAGCAAGGMYVEVAPPPSPEAVVVAPRPGWAWVEGRWEWSGVQWTWIQGYWVTERPGYVWVQGQWIDYGGRWQWRGGHWRRAPGVRDHR
jgi:hypothetical protein